MDLMEIAHGGGFLYGQYFAYFFGDLVAFHNGSHGSGQPFRALA
jgi:hypothetical protein